MIHNQENSHKTPGPRNVESGPSFTERVKKWFPDLRTKHQQAIDKQTLEQDLAVERKSIEEDEQRKREKVAAEQRKK